MIVCLCNPVSDKDIRLRVAQGCESFRDLANQLGLAQQCGRCACVAKQVFDAANGLKGPPLLPA